MTNTPIISPLLHYGNLIEEILSQQDASRASRLINAFQNAGDKEAFVLALIAATLTTRVRASYGRTA